MNKLEAIARSIPYVFRLNYVKAKYACRPTITPAGISAALSLEKPSQAQIVAALRMARTLEATFAPYGVTGVRVNWRAGRVNVEIPLPHQAVHIAQLARVGDALPLGLALDGQTVRFRFDDESPHLLVLGPTGGGKTTLVRAILRNLGDAPVAVLALKRKPWQAVQGATLLTDKDDIEAFSKWLRAEMYRRAKTGEDAPMYIVIDDVLNLLGLMSLPIDEYASLGRETGIHLILTSQRAGESAGGAAVTGNITSRVVFGVASGIDASTMTGRAGTGAERLSKWHALLVTPAGETRFQAAYIGREEVVQVAPVRGWETPGAGQYAEKHTPGAVVSTDMENTIIALDRQGYSLNRIIERMWGPGSKNAQRLRTVKEIIDASKQLVS